MPEPHSTAAASIAWAKWGHVFAGALGIAATLAYMRTMTQSQLVLVGSSGAIMVLWGTPVAMAIARGYLPGDLSQDVMDGITGLTGALMGGGGIFIVSGLLRIGEGFAADPWALIDRLRGRNGGAE